MHFFTSLRARISSNTKQAWLSIAQENFVLEYEIALFMYMQYAHLQYICTETKFSDIEYFVNIQKLMDSP